MKNPACSTTPSTSRLRMPARNRSSMPSTNNSRAAVQADIEALVVDRRVARRIVAKRRQQLAKLVISAVAQHQRLRDRFAERADADLQRAAVRHQARGVQPGGIVAERDRLARRREQRKVRRRIVEQQIEFVRGDRRVAVHERQFRIGLAREQKVGAAFAAQRQKIERQVGIAAQAVRRGASPARCATNCATTLTPRSST